MAQPSGKSRDVRLGVGALRSRRTTGEEEVVIAELGGYDIREQRSTRGGRSGKAGGEWKHEDERKIIEQVCLIAKLD